MKNLLNTDYTDEHGKSTDFKKLISVRFREIRGIRVQITEILRI